MEDNQKKILRGVSLYFKEVEKSNFSVLIDGDRIAEVDRFENLKDQFPFVEIIDFPGYIYPAFFDSHVHLKEVSNLLFSTDATEFKDYHDIEKILLDKDMEPFFIYNLNFDYLTVEEWEKIFNIPLMIFIQSRDEHSAFASRRFLESRNINIEEVEGGVLVKNKGRFTGIFRDNAISLLSPIKERDVEPLVIDKVFDYFLKRGITSVVNFDFSLYPFLEELKINGLKLRIIQGMSEDFLADAVKNNIKTNDGDLFLKFGPVKFFMDGSLGSRTCFMKKSFPFRGLLTMDPGELAQMVKFANSNEIQVAVHAIGSEAVSIVLETFFKYGRPEMRNRIEHLQFIDKEDLTLLKQTDFIASMQPGHALDDFIFFEKIFGDYKYAYAWNTALKADKILAFGSDAPVLDAAPLLGIYAAVSRIPEGRSKPFQPEERISVRDALNAYTRGASHATFSENYTGQIKKGNLADFVVLEKSLFKDNINSILGTILGGKTVWMK